MKCFILTFLLAGHLDPTPGLCANVPVNPKDCMILYFHGLCVKLLIAGVEELVSVIYSTRRLEGPCSVLTHLEGSVS